MPILKPKNIKLIIFDLDGTLVDAYLAISKSFNYTMHKLKYPLQSSLTIRRKVGLGDKNLLKNFIKAGDLNRALSIYRQHHKAALVRWSHLLPGVRSTLNYLKAKGYRLAIASNRPTKFAGLLIRHLKIDNYFACVLCADRLKKLKPHPEILTRIMTKLEVLSNETVFVGDMAIDAKTSKRAKVKAVIVTTGSNTKNQIQKEKPYKIIKKITDLLKIL